MTFHQRQGIIVAALALLQGCGSSVPAVITQTRTVEVPVSVPCRIPSIVAPAWAIDQIDPASDVYTKGRAALVEIQQRRAYEERQAAAIAACQ